MTPSEVSAYPVETPHAGRDDPMAMTRRRMAANGQWQPGQVAGRRWPIGCVALEITQRCNLDCTICYLSEISEAVPDLPIAEVERRIDMIHALYGPGTNLQITGGEPTLRDRAELLRIVRYAADRGLRPALFTNGIRARRPLLSALVDNGLVDVAFHIDLTEQLKGYDSERALHAVRSRCIEAVRGLPLAVYFNTTVFAGNLTEVPDIARFFVAHADVINLASFQIQADTGRGIDRFRHDAVTLPRVEAAINEGADGALVFGQLQPGHGECNRYAIALVCNGRTHALAPDGAFAARMMDATQDLTLDRRSPVRSIARAARWLAAHPRHIGPTMGWAAGRGWAMRRDLWAARGRVHKLSFMIHNFMDASALQCERLDACIFHTATEDGTVPMCLHNARRDEFILSRLRTPGGGPDGEPPLRLTPKTRKGRAKHPSGGSDGVGR